MNRTPSTRQAPVEKIDKADSPAGRVLRARPANSVEAAQPIPANERWSARGAIIVGLIGITLLIGGFGIWSVTARIAGAVVASGQVEVEQRRQVVQHPDGGVVQDIFVRDGQSVEPGQPLIALDGTMLRTELTIVEGQYYEILARRGRLEAERADLDTIIFPEELLRGAQENPTLATLISGQQSLFDARRDTLQQSLGQLAKQSEQVTAQIKGIDAQSDALDRQRGFILEELESQRSLLDRGLAQSARVLGLEREAARLDGQLGEIAAQRAQSVTRLTEIDLLRLEKAAERREMAETELRDLGYRELELAERRRGLQEQNSRLEIRAPVSGVIQEMQVTTPRSVIRAAEPILYLIPQDRPLVIAARINTINVDEVHTGQEVVLRFSAFSSRTTPEITGVLERISPDALVDEATRAPYYRGEVTIPPQELVKLGDRALVPGMPVEVYIKTDERSPLAYLLKPLADYFTRAFREE